MAKTSSDADRCLCAVSTFHFNDPRPVPGSSHPGSPCRRSLFFLVFCLSRGALFANPVVTQHSHTELGGANLLSFRLSIFSGDLRRLPRVRPRHITFFSLSLSSSSLASCRGKKLGTRESVDVSGFFPPFPPFAAYF